MSQVNDLPKCLLDITWADTMTCVEAPRLRLPETRRAAGLDVIPDQTRATVFAAILSGGPVTRSEAAQRTGLSNSTITKVVAPLIEAGYLAEVSPAKLPGSVGRPLRTLRVVPDRHVVVGVKLHPDLVTAVLTDMEARVLARVEHRLHDRQPGPTLTTAADAVHEVLDQLGADRPEPLGIGVAASGHIDSQTGCCLHSGVHGWHNVDIAGPLAAATGLPVVVSNDVNALGVAEHWFGKGRDSASFAVVTVGAGIGCCLFIRGRLHVGSTGLAGELGHLPIDPNGPACSCGNNGCLEAIASTSAILGRIAEHGGPRLRSVAKAAQLASTDTGTAGDAARAAFAAAGDALGRGLAALSNLVNPERVILSGEGVRQYDLFSGALIDAFQAHAFSTAATDCDLVVDAVDDDLWARGAASVVIQRAVGARPR